LRVESPVHVVRFGVFEAHLKSAELYKSGRLVRLQQQPFELLRALLEHPGELVTRDSLRRTLWPDGVTVDFDQSLNKSVTKLRQALGDTASSPRFVETLPKRGYRFIAPVTVVIESAVTDREEPRESTPAESVSVETMPPLPAAPEPALKTPAAAEDTGRQTSMLVALAIAVALIGSVLIAWAKVIPAAIEPRAEVTKSRRFAPSAEARDAYARGVLALAGRGSEGLRLSIDHFDRAIQLSPRYADAYVGLSDGWSLMSSNGSIDSRYGMMRAREAAIRALTLDPASARAHVSLGRVTMIVDWDWATAEWHFTRAITLEPGEPTAHEWYAYLLSATGRYVDAIAEARRAVQAEPQSLNARTALGFVLYLARRYDEAAAELERTLTVDPDFVQARRDLALVRVQQRRYSEALADMERVAAINAGAAAALADVAWLHALTGDRAKAHGVLADLGRRDADASVAPDSLALVSLGLGNRDEGIRLLEHAFEMKIATLVYLSVDPVWDGIRDDPRVQQMVAAAHPNW
jgi:DNA-binding winged helix-turn-helix (wHTH) protein/tetratricopeptide (TPR) repeat protein